MPINVDDIMEFLDNLAREERLRVTIKECAKAGAIVGVAAAISGVLLGPPGIALGAGAAGCAAAACSHNKFKSVVEILATMEPEKKEELAENVRRIINGVNATDIAVFTALVAGSNDLRDQVVHELCHYMTTQMNLAVQGRM